MVFSLSLHNRKNRLRENKPTNMSRSVKRLRAECLQFNWRHRREALGPPIFTLKKCTEDSLASSNKAKCEADHLHVLPLDICNLVPLQCKSSWPQYTELSTWLTPLTATTTTVCGNRVSSIINLLTDTAWPWIPYTATSLACRPMAGHHSPEYSKLPLPISHQAKVQKLTLQILAHLSSILGILIDQRTKQLTTLTGSIEYDSKKESNIYC